MISVCIATYNGADVLAVQLKSILAQLGEEDEVVISDDGSTDGTAGVAASLGDERVKIIKGPCKGSPIPNFENALRHAQGDYIFLSDQDDKWLAGKVDVSLAALQNEGYDCVMTDCTVTNAALRPMHPSFFALNHTRENRYYNLLVRSGYIGGCMAFTRRLRDKCLPFPKDIPMHDMWIGNVAAFRFRIKFIHQSYSLFRRTGDNASTSGARSNKPLLTRLLFRWRTLRALLALR